MASVQPLVAFFGATGGCCAAALTRSLKAGYQCTALARTPSKLTELLISKGVSLLVISSQLSIIQGDVRDLESVKKTLALNGITVDVIISGIGIYSVSPTTICTTATTTILSALSLLRPTQKPLFLAISSTGITSGPRDVPLAFYHLYKIILANPHKDKHAMEQTLMKTMLPGNTETWIRGFVIVRPSLLTNGPGSESAALGKARPRVGTEKKPAIGYTVSREDVGHWIFENVVQDEKRDRWTGEKVSLTN